MTCPKCYAEFESSPVACPECGLRLIRNVSGLMKTSAVLIAARGAQTFYRSVQDVPEPLRTQLIECTHSENSGTIVIADRAGKEQITQVVARRESPNRPGVKKERPSGERHQSESGWRVTYLEYKFLGYSWVVWAGVLLFLAAACLIAAVFTMRA